MSDAEHSLSRILEVREAIIERSKGQRNVRGTMDCPLCEGTVHYTVMWNGHVHAKCSGEDCVQWME